MNYEIGIEMTADAIFILLVCAILIALAVMTTVGYVIACRLDQPNSDSGQSKSQPQRE
jgi:hypothetical protein|tara:strand:+ start:52 stop:225 length:174 start_codon:yes stop_codon:yes gene_type:complete